MELETVPTSGILWKNTDLEDIPAMTTNTNGTKDHDNFDTIHNSGLTFSSNISPFWKESRRPPSYLFPANG